ncbi:hypothetical protein F4680DRAFT_467071 [Xylaria scruposa]|nr:hypothetical protein F4680DRAFT_467071 [Xylaria scruposa]
MERSTTPPPPGPFSPPYNLGPDAFKRPSSPWAARYKITKDDFLHDLDEFHHSSFAPEYPRLDPRHYGDSPDSKEKFHGFGRGLHEDRLLYSEFQQRHELKIYSWQVGVLNRYVGFGPRFPKLLGGHNRVKTDKNDPDSVIAAIRSFTGVDYATSDEALTAVYHSERIKVDDSKWFRFFRKSRWWDPDPGDEPALGLRWSVDDPKVWAQLEIVLELANRMLNALVDDKHEWLRTILFGRLDYWENFRDDAPSENARILLSREVDRLACQSQGIQSFWDTNPVLPDWRYRLEQLCRQARWTFKDDPGSYIMGLTDPARGGLMSVDVTFLRLLVGDEITLSERCLLTIMSTTTILHELMHHINIVRTYSGESDINNYLDPWHDPRPELEPFVDYDGEAEMGWAYEKAVTGGIIQDAPGFVLPINVVYISWPGFRGGNVMNPNHYCFSPDHEFKTWRITSTWASMMLSSSFWDDPTIPKKSDNRFHLAPLFISHTKNIEPMPRTWGPVVVDRNVTNTSSLDKELIKDWDERTNLWANLRQGWYDVAVKRWWESPWSETGLRPGLNDFAQGFKDHDEIKCAQEANGLVKVLPWDDAASFMESLPPYDNKGWVYSATGMHLSIHLPPPLHSIKTVILRGVQTGLLMLAACPMRKTFLVKLASESNLTNGGTIRPSVFAEDDEFEVIERRPIKNKDEELVISPPVVGNPFRGQPQAYANTQFDYLNMVSDLIHHFGTTKYAVSGPWLFEIMRVGRLLLNERTRMALDHPADWMNRWVPSWDFRVPEYVSSDMKGQRNDGLWVEWDANANAWRAGDLWDVIV